MDIKNYETIFKQQLAKPCFKKYMKLEQQPDAETTLKFVMKKMQSDERNDKKGYTETSLAQYWTTVKIRDFFAAQVGRIKQEDARDAKAEEYMQYVKLMQQGCSVYAIAKMFGTDRHGMSRKIRRGIKYLNKNHETNYDYEQLKKAKYMTKNQKTEWMQDYMRRRECGQEEAEKALNEEIKTRERKQRSDDKRRMTIAKNAIKEQMSEYGQALKRIAELVAENEELKRTIADMKGIIASNRMGISYGSASAAVNQTNVVQQKPTGGEAEHPECDLAVIEQPENTMSVVNLKNLVIRGIVSVVECRNVFKKAGFVDNEANAALFRFKECPSGYCWSENYGDEGAARRAERQKAFKAFFDEFKDAADQRRVDELKKLCDDYSSVGSQKVESYFKGKAE